MDVTCWRAPSPHWLGDLLPHTLRGLNPAQLPPTWSALYSPLFLLHSSPPSLGLPASSCLSLPSLALWLLSVCACLFPLPPFPALFASLALCFFPSVCLSVSPSASLPLLPSQTHWGPAGCPATPALTPCLLALPLPDSTGGHPGVHSGSHVGRDPAVGGRVGGAAHLPTGEWGLLQLLPSNPQNKALPFYHSHLFRPKPRGSKGGCYRPESPDSQFPPRQSCLFHG